MRVPSNEGLFKYGRQEKVLPLWCHSSLTTVGPHILRNIYAHTVLHTLLYLLLPIYR